MERQENAGERSGVCGMEEEVARWLRHRGWEDELPRQDGRYSKTFGDIVYTFRDIVYTSGLSESTPSLWRSHQTTKKGEEETA